MFCVLLTCMYAYVYCLYQCVPDITTISTCCKVIILGKYLSCIVWKNTRTNTNVDQFDCIIYVKSVHNLKKTHFKKSSVDFFGGHVSFTAGKISDTHI